MTRARLTVLAFLAFASVASAGQHAADADGTFAQAVADRVKVALILQRLPFLAQKDLDSLHAELQAFVARLAPREPPEPRRSAILNALDPYVAEHFPRTTPDKAYLEYRDQVGTLKWALWLALTRKGLTPEQFAKREEQRTWMRDYIGSLPDHPEFGTQAEELAKLERFFADPLLPPFQEPMTAELFAAFREVFERRKPRHAGHAAGNLRLRTFTIVYPARVLRQTRLPFDERAQGFALSSSRWHMEFESNAGLRPRRHQLEPLEARRSALFDLSCLRVMSCRAGAGEANFRKWLANFKEGDLAYDAEAKALIAIREAKLAMLDVGTWFEVDRVTDAELRERLAKHGAPRVSVGSFRFRDPALGADRPIAFVGIGRPCGTLDVVRLIRWTHRDALGIETRPRPSSLVRSEPREEKPPEPEARAEPWTPPKRAYGKVDSFESVSVAIVPHYPGDARKRQIDIRADGAVTYALSGTLAGRKIDHRASFRLTLEHLRELERLLETTGWLTKPGVDKTLRHTHPTEYTVTLTRAGKLHRLNCYDTREGPYWPLFVFFHRIDRQERLLWKLTKGDASARRHAARDINGELRGLQGDPGKMVTAYPVVDYWRFVPVLSKWVADPEGRHHDELAAAVRLLGHLRVESQWKHIVALARRERPPEQAIADSMVHFGGERAARELGRLVTTSHSARWALIRLGPAAVPTIVQILETPHEPNHDPAYPLVRAYIDRWKEVPGPLDPRIVEAAHRCLEARRWRPHMIQYFEQLVRLIETSSPPPGRLVCRVTPGRAEMRRQPYSFQWRIARLEPLRLLHGWFTVVDGRPKESAGGSIGPQATTNRIYLNLEVAVEDGALALEMRRTEWQLAAQRETHSVASRIAVPAGAELAHVRRLREQARLSDRHTILWQADLVREGKVVKTVVYAARVVPQDDPATTFQPPREAKSAVQGAQEPLPQHDIVLRRRRDMLAKALASTPVDTPLLRKALQDIGHVAASYRGKPVEQYAEGVPTIAIDGRRYLEARVALDRGDRGPAPDAWIDKLTAPVKQGFTLRLVRLAMAPRPDTAGRRDRALAAADAQIRSGLLALAAKFPQLRTTSHGTLEGRLAGKSQTGTITIRAARLQGSKGGARERVAERDRYHVLVVLEPLRWSGDVTQLARFPLYPHLALMGQVGTSAGDPKLAAALKKLLADALAPLNEVSNRAYELNAAEELRRRQQDIHEQQLKAKDEAIRRQRRPRMERK